MALVRMFRTTVCRLSTTRDLVNGLCDSEKLPYSIRVLLESAIRNCDQFEVHSKDVENILNWETLASKQIEIPFKPARVILQDFTGVPAVVDLGNSQLIQPPCAMLWSGWVATPRRSTLWCPWTWSSTTPCRPTSPESRTPTNRTSKSSSRGTTRDLNS